MYFQQTLSSRTRRHRRVIRTRQILGQVLNPRLRTGTRLVRLRRHIDSILRTARHMEMIVDLLQLPRLAAPDRGIHPAPECAQRPLNLHRRVCLRRARHDPRKGEEGVAVERLEQVDDFLEEIDDFSLRRVVDVAFWFKGRDAGAVGAPFVLPEGFVGTVVVFPVRVHVGEERGGAVGL